MKIMLALLMTITGVVQSAIVHRWCYVIEATAEPRPGLPPIIDTTCLEAKQVGVWSLGNDRWVFKVDALQEPIIDCVPGYISGVEVTETEANAIIGG